MRLGSRGGGGARVCMRWDGRGGVWGGRSESEWVGIGRNRGFSDTWPEPCNVRDVQLFLGFCNFYHRFIDPYSKISHPLTNLCCKTVPWRFGEHENAAFLHMKEAFTSAPVLCHWMPDMPMTLETDTSNHAIAAILSVTTPDQLLSTPVPCMMQKRTMTSTTKNC